MPRDAKRESAKKNDSTANHGFEAKPSLAPDKGRIDNPACGSGPAAAGFVPSKKLVELRPARELALAA